MGGVVTWVAWFACLREWRGSVCSVGGVGDVLTLHVIIIVIGIIEILP